MRWITDMNDTLKILLVEDDDGDYFFTKSVLEEAYGDKCSIDWKNNIGSALQATQDEHYDVFLFSLNVGAENGIDLTRQVQSQGSETPVVLLTGTGGAGVEAEARQAGASEFLAKQHLSAPLIERTIRYAVEQKKDEQALRRLAHYDPLTGLANRTLFNLRLSEGIATAKRLRESIALLVLDLDHFKKVNDTFGHPVGDKLLQAVAARVSDCVRETDTVARLGGDEFAVIATHLGRRDNAAVVANKVIRGVARVSQVDDQVLSTSASVGIAFFPEDAYDVDDLLKRADLALYQAKDAGRGVYRFYDSDLDKKTRAVSRLQAQMFKSIQKKHFVLHYQPIVETETSKLVGVEALVRWEHPGQGLVGPRTFIPIAESSGLIIVLGEWILKQACRQLKEYQDSGLEHLSVSVNISAVQFNHEKLFEHVAAAIDQSGILPSQLELEITESTLMSTATQVNETLQKLSELGVKLCVDDFGTGYSSLAYLKRFPLNRLKIDRSFIQEVLRNQDDAAITRAIITMAKALRLEVVAEGVETDQQFAFLRNHGCETVQGFFVSRPMPGEKLLQWHQRYCASHDPAGAD
ncbi:EAL domain-containing protein [Exilibacterium tricleocarpae]|uniref:cyclic-guanylate-specific phosphodiesterase n=2 Tax=Exilibacterium tricleocarpae TaxID=2591008 RepID=A0A545SMH6_9GAMM|nr:EAL domain-containing protein [Exilibacterium tricleocarpae]